MKKFIEVKEHKNGRSFTRIYPARSAIGAVPPDQEAERAYGIYIDFCCSLCGHTVCSCPSPQATERPVLPENLAPSPKPEDGWSIDSDWGFEGYKHVSGYRVGFMTEFGGVWKVHSADMDKEFDFTYCPTLGEAVKHVEGLIHAHRIYRMLEPPVPEGWELDALDDWNHPSGALVSIRTLKGKRVWCWWPAGAKDDENCEDPKQTRDEAMAAALASVQTAQPELRPGWEQYGEPRHERYRNASLGVAAVLSLAGTWIAFGLVRTETGHPTLEAACLRAEQLAELEGPR